MLNEQKRSLRIDGRTTTVRLERPFWEILERMAAGDGETVKGVIARIDAERRARAAPGTESLTLASCLRVACLSYLAPPAARRPGE